MKCKGVGKSDIGQKRTNNEDSFLVLNEPIGSLPSLFIVADGIGGSQAGEVASEKAVRYFSEYVSKNFVGTREEIMCEAVNYANTEICKLADENPDYKGMGTTFIAATVVRGELLFVHAGDSRMYFIRGGIVRRITTDHTFENELIQSGALSRAQAAKVSNRSAITKWIGTPGGVEPDVGHVRLGKDSYVLMCSDGLSNMLTEAEILEIITLDTTTEEKVDLLINKANENGGRDNITVILIKS